MRYNSFREIENDHPLWFSKDTMRFFKSKVYGIVYEGCFFISSEKPPHDNRFYSIRYADSDQIKTILTFNSLKKAENFVKRYGKELIILLWLDEWNKEIRWA